MNVIKPYMWLAALAAMSCHRPLSTGNYGDPSAATDGPFWSLLIDDPTSSEGHAGREFQLWLDDRMPESQPRNRRSKRSVRRHRIMWCKRYEGLISGITNYGTLPYVQDFWHKGISLAELDETFSSMRTTDRHDLYRAWMRHRHHIRAAELDRSKGDEHYKSYTGYIMGDPEILALAQQLHEIEQSMAASAQTRVFKELLQVMLAARKDVDITYEAQRNRTFVSVVSRYHPKPSDMEGGCTDSKNMPLFTLDRFLSGRAPYVSIALDVKLYRQGRVRYGDEFWIPRLDDKYRQDLETLGIKHIVFRAVDTGGGFTGKGFSRLDLCVTSESYETRYDSGGKTLGEVRLVKVQQSMQLHESKD